ncbi:MAG: hybrid sensor histidine kinase/response regulator [Oligoflexia bacterium]|nr:hybrid sensor histidine kinase/response regulator [Oligoflexia bacterium]
MEESVRKPKICLVDDMRTNIMVLEKYLSKDRYEVFSFTSPLEALENVPKIMPDIFLLDVEMDEMNGFELCLKVRAIEGLQEVPVVFITTLNDTESLEKGLQVGATEFLNKDMNPYELNLRINNTLKVCVLNKEIREKNLQLERSSESNRILVRLLCHDINNPLTTQKLNLERMVRSEAYKSDPIIQKYINATIRGVDQIFSIIDHVRQISAIEDGKVCLEIAPVKLLDVIEEIKFMFEDRWKKKNIQFSVDDSKLPENIMVLADKTSLIHQVFANLLSNAIKFSHEGQNVSINFEDKGDIFEIKLQDNGIGIPTTMLKDIFKAHVKTSRLGTDKEKGTGFGLPLVKSYVEKYGGIINVESKSVEESANDHGTTFVIKLKKAG